MSIDHFHYKQYNEQTYNCAHFAAELWEHLTGQTITENLSGFMHNKKNRRVVLSKLKRFFQIQQPESPCIVFFQSITNETHVGIFYNKKVMHIGKNGVLYENLQTACLGFNNVRFYKCR